MRHESPGNPAFGTAEYDPLDLHMQRLGVSRGSTWSKVSSQGALLLLTGIALGSQGLAILTPEILEVLQPAVPVALAVLGVTAVFGSVEGGRFSGRTSAATSAVVLVVGVTLALQQRGVMDALTTTIQAASIALLLAGAGWDLSSRGSGDEERRVFSIATLLLLGGVAEYLSVSALLLGWIAASAWRLVRKELDQVRLEAAYVQHPMTALLLVMAGARVTFSWQTVALAALTAGAALTVALLFRRRRGSRAVAFGGAPLPLATFAVALAMDASRLDGRLATMLSIVVLAAAIVDAMSAAPADASA
jgi:hypothetical protein